MKILFLLLFVAISIKTSKCNEDQSVCKLYTKKCLGSEIVICDIEDRKTYWKSIYDCKKDFQTCEYDNNGFFCVNN